MRVGILTSWCVPCGVYQYSARMADALAQIDGVEPVILAGLADSDRRTPEESLHEVIPVADIGLWRSDGQYMLEVEEVLKANLDVLHVQYQSMLFNQEPLAFLADSFEGPTAITFHDNCQRPDFPYDTFDIHFSHRWNIGPASVEVIPFGIEERPPIVRTFGLGRTRSDLIEPICTKNGWVFETTASHEPIHGGGQFWRTHEDLMTWLRGADAIVLWYDDHQQAGASQAARTAMASRRPVITNDTKWFEDLPLSTVSYTKVKDLASLETTLAEHFRTGRYVQENSWNVVANRLIERYASVQARNQIPSAS